MSEDGDVTRLLQQLGHGGRDALDRFLPMVYAELEQLARRQLRGERGDHTLQTTDLVHEAYVKLGGLERIEWKNRAQFFAIAAQAMRRVLVDHAAGRRAAKRGGAQRRVPLDESMLATEERTEEILALNAALSALERVQPRLVRIVECRYFAGLSIEETAEALEVSPATVKRDWTFARAFMLRELGAGT
jgi:RNA polymerase sigma factor (TIGR02999 family)